MEHRQIIFIIIINYYLIIHYATYPGPQLHPLLQDIKISLLDCSSLKWKVTEQEYDDHWLTCARDLAKFKHQTTGANHAARARPPLILTFFVQSGKCFFVICTPHLACSILTRQFFFMCPVFPQRKHSTFFKSLE